MQRRELIFNAGMAVAALGGASAVAATQARAATPAAAPAGTVPAAAPPEAAKSNHTDALGLSTPAPRYVANASVIYPFRARVDRIARFSVCTRPFRMKGPRIELEKIAGKNVVHNYGHGGSGWSLSWGSAMAAASLVRSTNVKEVAVVGCGALGLTAAVYMVRSGLKVKIYTRERAPDIRSFNATGVWSPSSRVGTVEQCDPVRWEELCRNSFRMYQSLMGLPGDPVQWIESYALSDIPFDEAAAKHKADEAGEPVHFAAFDERTQDLIPGNEDMAPGTHPFPTKYVQRTSTMMYNIPAYMNWLEHEFLINGGQIEYIDLQSPHDFAKIKEKTIVNSTGYGARALLNDDSLVPVRGQLGHMVPQPEINYTISYKNAYMTPRRDGLLVQNNRTDMDGYNNPSVIPNRAESEEVIQILAGVFGRMASPA
jgi:glycine/D-amino acid oxidase-like deaminating enzyme